MHIHRYMDIFGYTNVWVYIYIHASQTPSSLANSSVHETAHRHCLCHGLISNGDNNGDMYCDKNGDMYGDNNGDVYGIKMMMGMVITMVMCMVIKMVICMVIKMVMGMVIKMMLTVISGDGNSDDGGGYGDKNSDCGDVYSDSNSDYGDGQ